MRLYSLTGRKASGIESSLNSHPRLAGRYTAEPYMSAHTYQKGTYMQPQTIAYTFDHDNSGGTAAIAVTLTRHKETVDSSTYVTPTHSDLSADHLKFYRTEPKRSGNFYGTQKVAVKRTKGRSVPTPDGNNTVAPSIVEISAALPVGMTAAAKLEDLMELIGFLSSSEGKAAMIALFNQSSV